MITVTVLSFLTLFFLAVTAYVYVGYPSLVAVWARHSRAPVRIGPHTPRVSLIIAAYNEQGVIADKIRNSLELDYPRDKIEIIVVADGSSDGTFERACAFRSAGVLALHQPERRGKSAALNRAVAHSTGDILVFSDANAFYNKDAIRMLVRNFADPEVGSVSGKKRVRRSDTETADAEGFYWRYEAFIRMAESETGSTVAVVGEIIAIRRSLFETIPEHIINDDLYLALCVMRQRHRVIYEPDAVATESAAASMAEEVVRRRRIAAGRFQQMLAPSLWADIPPEPLFKLVSHKFLRLLLPFFMAGAFVCNVAGIALPNAPDFLAWTLVAQVAGYGLALAGLMVRPGSVMTRIPLAARYVLASNLAVAAGLHCFLTGRASVLWQKVAR